MIKNNDKITKLRYKIESNYHIFELLHIIVEKKYFY
jgi:hypothetical protein